MSFFWVISKFTMSMACWPSNRRFAAHRATSRAVRILVPPALALVDNTWGTNVSVRAKDYRAGHKDENKQREGGDYDLHWLPLGEGSRG